MNNTGPDENELPVISRRYGCGCGKLEICTYIGGLIHIILYIVLMIWTPSVTPNDPLYIPLHDMLYLVILLSSLGIVLILTTFVGTIFKRKILLIPWMIYSFTLILVQISCINLYHKYDTYSLCMIVRDGVYTSFCFFYWGVVMILCIKFSRNNGTEYESIS